LSTRRRYFHAPRRLGLRQTTGEKVCSNCVRSTSQYYTITDLSKEEYLNASQSKASAKGKAPDAAAPKRDKFSDLSRRQKRQKTAVEADKEFNDKGAVDSAIRAAKHAQRPRRIGEESTFVWREEQDLHVSCPGCPSSEANLEMSMSAACNILTPLP